MKCDRNYSTVPVQQVCLLCVVSQVATAILPTAKLIVGGDGTSPYTLLASQARNPSSTHDDGSVSSSMAINIVRKRVTRRKDKKYLEKETEDAAKG
jgi:hypothetical protein